MVVTLARCTKRWPRATRRMQSTSTLPATLRWRIPSKSTAISSGTSSAFSAIKTVRLPAAWVRARRSFSSRRRLEERSTTEPRSPSTAAKSFGGVLALGDDPHVLLERQHSGCACAEDSLVISENNSIHKCRNLRPGANDPQSLWLFPYRWTCWRRRGNVYNSDNLGLVDATLEAGGLCIRASNFLNLASINHQSTASYVECLKARQRSIKGYA